MDYIEVYDRIYADFEVYEYNKAYSRWEYILKYMMVKGTLELEEYNTIMDYLKSLRIRFQGGH